MQEFLVYLKMGFQHILDPEGLDHVLFVITLCALYKTTQWKNVLVLVTAFTIGHSLTLALSALEIVQINADLIEFLIPITILTTAYVNIKKGAINSSDSKYNTSYMLALVFGLIHGLGFSNYFKAIMMGQDSIVFPLFSFNVGIELGQLIIVGLVMSTLAIYTKFKPNSHRDWNMVLSSAGGGVAFTIIIEKLFMF